MKTILKLILTTLIILIIIWMFLPAIVQAQYHPKYSIARGGLCMPDTGKINFILFRPPDSLRVDSIVFILPDTLPLYNSFYLKGSLSGDTITLSYDTTVVSMYDSSRVSGHSDSSDYSAVTDSLKNFNWNKEKIRQMSFTLTTPLRSDTICFKSLLPDSIVITSIHVTCERDPTTELNGNIMYADALIGLANAVLINDFDTANGVRFDATLTQASVPTAKCLYLLFHLTPEADNTQISFTICYYYL